MERKKTFYSLKEVRKKLQEYDQEYVAPHFQIKAAEEEGRKNIPGLVARILQRGEEAKERRLEAERTASQQWRQQDLDEGKSQLIEDLHEEFSRRTPNAAKSRRARRNITGEARYKAKKGLREGQILNGWGPYHRERKVDYHKRIKPLIENWEGQQLNAVAYEEEDRRAGILPRRKRK